MQEKKKRVEGGGDGGKEKGKGKEEEDGEDALDWWSRYYETLKDRERNERKEAQEQMARASKKKEKRTEEESEEEKLKKKIPRLTVRCSALMGCHAMIGARNASHAIRTHCVSHATIHALCVTQ